MWMLWKDVLNSGPNFGLQNFWKFSYSPVVWCPAISFGIKGRQRSNEAFVLPTKFYSIRSVCIMRECKRKKSEQFLVLMWFSSQHYPKFTSKIISETVSQVSTKNARPDLSFARYISTFCVLQDNITVIQFSVWLSFLIQSVHGSNKIRKLRVKAGFQIVNFRRLWRFLSKNITFPSLTFWYIVGWDNSETATAHWPSTFS